MRRRKQGGLHEHSGAKRSNAAADRRSGDHARERLLAGLPVTERRLQLAGVSTAVLEGGDGPPVILLHGPAGFAANWTGVIPALVASHRVISPDLPGHGASEVATLAGRRAPAGMARRADRADLPGAARAGRPMLGGAIAARFASDPGHHRSQLVLVGAFGLNRLRPSPEFGSACAQFLGRPTQATHQGLWRDCASIATAWARGWASAGSVRGLRPGGARPERAGRALPLMQHSALPAIRRRSSRGSRCRRR